MTWQQRYESSVMNTFGTPALALTRGEGARVWDTDGKAYLDLFGGIAVNALGHAHPALVHAVTRQLQTLGHVSNLFTSEPQVALAERLVGLFGHDARVFFANSGSEANEAALKLTRLTGRSHVVAAHGAFHGRTMGSLSLTAKEAYRAPFEPLPGDVTWVPYGDSEALAAAVTDATAAVVLEPLQGEAGVLVPPDGYLVDARRITREHGTLLWLDEVQTGIGRTGRWFAHQAVADLEPDIVTLAKGLGGGVPIGATIAGRATAALFSPGNHGTTFGGNPVACAAALAVLDTIESDGLLDHVVRLGKRLSDVVASAPEVVAVRGSGLMIGADLAHEVAPQVVQAGRDAGFLLNATGPSTLRFVPPLVLTDGDVDQFAAAWPGILAAADSAGTP
ncbi:acetylornithine transaminase [Nocardioides sp. 616]|uniref:acetylornithine transaminase n=1 Tax=Nocardioides sp. 616 TaxID=2268090 RepID=UPI000CE52D3E|nr:acetylornithine transaminase [Nocardioides sp. 616]